MRALSLTLLSVIKSIIPVSRDSRHFARNYAQVRTYSKQAFTLPDVRRIRAYVTKKVFFCRPLSRVLTLNVFTKVTNLNKLYVVGSGSIFLSPGIILRFLKLFGRKSLKKHRKV